MPGALAWALESDGSRCLVGTRDALVLASATGAGDQWAWEDLTGAEWDRESGTLTLRPDTEVRAGPAIVIGVARADRLLQLVRERISATVLLERSGHVGGRTVRVIAHRRASGRGAVRWAVSIDGRGGAAALAALTAEQRAAVERLVAQARADVGL